jgi:glycosyltransferase involved in cell wall biosynthesis
VGALARRHDVVFASSPPLPGALAAGAAARARRVPFVLDVRDLWSAAAEALGELSQPALVRMLERGETWLYRNAAAVTATTRPFCREIDEAAGRPVSVHLPNGALDELLARPVRPLPPGGTFTVGYVGNLGIAQGLSIVFDAAAELRADDVRFLLVGDGPLAAELRARVEREALDNVELRGQVPTEQVGEVLDGCHALLVPLGAHAILEQFIPSKLYDAMAAGRAAIVAAGGEPAALVLRSGAGVAVPAEDGPALASAIRLLAADRDRVQRMGEAGRQVARRHARSAQNDRLEAVLLDASRRKEAA